MKTGIAESFIIYQKIHFGSRSLLSYMNLWTTGGNFEVRKRRAPYTEAGSVHRGKFSGVSQVSDSSAEGKLAKTSGVQQGTAGPPGLALQTVLSQGSSQASVLVRVQTLQGEGTEGK